MQRKEEKKRQRRQKKTNRQAANKVWRRESRRRRLQLDRSLVLARDWKMTRTGGVLFPQRSLAAGSALRRTHKNAFVRVPECVIYMFV